MSKMTVKLRELLIVITITMTIATTLLPASGGEIIDNVKVKSSGSVDLSSLDTILADILKPEMSEKEKVTAIFHFIRSYSYSHHYPTEFVNSAVWGMSGPDPVKFFNIYPWGECNVYQAVQANLYTAAGFPVRKKIITADGAHAVVEVFYDNAWHYIDASMGFYFLKRDGKTIASIDDLLNDPELLLKPVSFEGSLTVHKNPKRYLKQLTSGPITDSGIHKMGNRFHSMNISLSRGDEYILSTEKEGKDGFWYYPENISLKLKNLMDRKHKDRKLPPLPGTGPCPDPVAFKDANKNYKLPGFSNSKLICSLISKDGINRGRIYRKKNIVFDETPDRAIRPEKNTEEAEIIYRIAVPYIIVRGILDAGFSFGKNLDVNISISQDGKGFRQIRPEIHSEKGLNTYDITDLIYGKYEYWLKISFPPSESPVLLKGLKLTTIMQSAPASVPGLKQGNNDITVHCENPEAIDENKLLVGFSWEEQTDDEKKTIQKSVEKEIKGNRRTFQINCEGIPSVKNVKISVK